MKPVVTIAIVDLSGSAARIATLQSLARHTSEPCEVVLLVEEASRRHVLLQQNSLVTEQMRQAQQLVLSEPFSIPVGLNRLLKITVTPYVLLLESGSIVTTGWLDKLLAPLNDPTIGLSGPSTNSSWNEQKVLTGSEGVGWSTRQIDAYAADVAKRYAHQWHPLETLHSLSDFCYLFKRTVAEQLGGFDEAYGAGPCWEIDFNTRAARAGFHAIWVADAYVHRGPASPWKATSVRSYFTTSKQLYQDRFCGLRLEGKKTDYEPHCRGEACEHFAPRNLIQIALQPRCKDQPLEKPSVLSISSADPMPLISCIMPTRNRRAYIQQALSYFERQDYQNCELIIVDDGDEQIADLLPSDPRLHYITLSGQTSIGEKRNIACEQARGDIIAHWDDDDWYAPHRLSYQAAPLLDNKADITGLDTSCFFDLVQWQAWTCTPELHRRLFVGDVHGGTLVYRRSVWQHMARYPERSLAEDAFFLREACRRGARLQKLLHANSFVYIRHSDNAWKFLPGSYLQSAAWRQTDINLYLPTTDLSFYIALSPGASSSIPTSFSLGSERREEENAPLVSCIMPTNNRRTFILRSISYFLRQNYTNKELIIVDDGTDTVSDLIPVDERIRYIRLNAKSTIGAKRNLACEQARGSIIAHWDDDDWHAPYRLRYQVETLLHEGTELCGTYILLFYDMINQRAWQYIYPDGQGQRMWLSGNTLCYKRSFWASNRFANIDVGEDARFVWRSRRDRLTVLSDTSFHVGMIHRQNASPKKTDGAYWRPYAVEKIRQILGDDWAFYQPTGSATGS